MFVNRLTLPICHIAVPGLAVDVPTVCLFYIHTKAHLDAWAPEKSLYRCEVLTENIKVENIVNSLRKIME